MPNPLVKRAKRNTTQKVYFYIGVTRGGGVVRGVAFAYTLWSVQFVEGPTPTRTSGSFKSGVRR